jgi:DNA-binding winged helix-turn-helix (wHTH) protein
MTDPASIKIDRQNACVSVAGQNLDMPQLTYRLLLALAQAAPGVVPQSELLAQVWAGIHVAPETLKQRVKLLRETLRDAGIEGDPVPSTRGEGYRLAAAVTFTAQERTTSRLHRYWPYLAVTAALLIVASAFWLIDSRQSTDRAGLVIGMSAFSDTQSAQYSELHQALSWIVLDQFGRLEQVDTLAPDHATPQSELDMELVAFIQPMPDGDQLRLNLINTDTGIVIASEIYALETSQPSAQLDRIAQHFVARAQFSLITDFGEVLGSTSSHTQALEAFQDGVAAERVSRAFARLEAERFYRRSILLDPAFEAAKIRLALVLADQVRRDGLDRSLADEALQLARTQIAQAPLDADVQHAMAMALWALDQRTEAAIYLNQAMVRRPYLRRELAQLQREMEADAD